MFQKARIAAIMWSLCSVMGFASQVQLIGLNQYQQLNISTKHYPMQSNVIASQYNGEVYPQVIVGFDSDVRLSIGSVFNYSTDDYFFFNEHRQNISMAQLQYETLKLKGLMGTESGYVSLGFSNTISLIANKDEATTMGAFGLQFEAMDALDVKAHYIIGNTANAEGLADIKTLVSKIEREVPKKKRQPIFVIVDEFANFLNKEFLDVISMGRSANIHLIISHQNIEQLNNFSEEFKDTIIANTNNKIVFAQRSASAQDWAEMFGTKTKKYYTQSEDAEGMGVQGYNARLVEAFIVHPNKIKELPIGQCYFLSKEKNTIIRNRVQVPVFSN